jgi:hypothetical protein
MEPKGLLPRARFFTTDPCHEPNESYSRTTNLFLQDQLKRYLYRPQWSSAVVFESGSAKVSQGFRELLKKTWAYCKFL